MKSEYSRADREAYRTHYRSLRRYLIKSAGSVDQPVELDLSECRAAVQMDVRIPRSIHHAVFECAELETADLATVVGAGFRASPCECRRCVVRRTSGVSP